MIRYACYDSPFGIFRIGCDEDSVTSLRLCDCVPADNDPTALTDLVWQQLQEYFSGRRQSFSFSINPDGTAFQRLVWYALLQIPYGQTRTYGEIAAMIGKPDAARAVGNACNRNPVWIVIPCHRVVGNNRSLTGYAGGLAMKQVLLELEQSHGT